MDMNYEIKQAKVELDECQAVIKDFERKLDEALQRAISEEVSEACKCAREDTIFALKDAIRKYRHKEECATMKLHDLKRLRKMIEDRDEAWRDCLEAIGRLRDRVYYPALWKCTESEIIEIREDLFAEIQDHMNEVLSWSREIKYYKKAWELEDK